MLQKRLTKVNNDLVDDLEEWKKAKQLLKPKDQLELADNVSTCFKNILIFQVKLNTHDKQTESISYCTKNKYFYILY